MNMLKLFSLFVLIIGAFALRDEEEIDRSPILSGEISNDEETGMKLYKEGEDEDIDAEDEILEDEMLEDENAVLDASSDTQLEKRNPIVCAARRAACFVACRAVPFFLRRACRGVCNFALRFANRLACFAACRGQNFLIRGICYRLCNCLRG